MEEKVAILFAFVFIQNSLGYSPYNKNYPNIVLIVANQFGLADISYYGEKIKHIRRLAQESINFTHVYSQLYPTSSRAALLTGRLPVKSGMLKGRFLPFTSFPSVACSGGMPLSEETIAEVLQRRGYVSKFIGLWDLGLGKDGKFTPLNQGFQSWLGIIARHSEDCSSLPRGSTIHQFDEVLMFLYLVFSAIFGGVFLWYFRYLKLKFLLCCFALGMVIMYATNQGFHGITYISIRSCVLFRDRNILAQPYNVENLTIRFTEEAVQFIKQMASSETPFFLTVNHLLFSKPLFSSRVFSNTSAESGEFLNSLMELDWSIGNILDAISGVNITNDTLVIFTALSGSNHINVSLSDSSQGAEFEDAANNNNKAKGKGRPDNWENQITVPLYMKWKRRWKGGLRINETVTLMDIMPTILELTNQNSSNKTIDGKSLLPLITNLTDPLHKFVFHYLDVTQPSAVTYKKYKVFYYTITGEGRNMYHDPPLLFDITMDPLEMSPLPIDEHQEVIANVSQAVEKHLENRTRKWISQFEHPIFPWLFPCANFPYCYRTDVYKTDSIFNTSMQDQNNN